jgi:hypothetical protein
MIRSRGLEDVVRTIMPVLNEWELFYVVVEDLAKRIYGMPKDTTETELLVNLTDDEWGKLGRFLRAEDLVCSQRGVSEEGCAHFMDKRGGTTIRLTTAKDQFDMMTIGRRLVQDFSHSTVLVASVEDLILRELRTGKRKNFQEALDIYVYWKNHLDISYLVRTVRQMGLYDKFIKMKKKGDRR